MNPRAPAVSRLERVKSRAVDLHRRAGALAAALAFLAPRCAFACPACLGSDARNATFLKIGSLFVLVPFAVVATVLYVLRKAPPDGRRATDKHATR